MLILNTNLIPFGIKEIDLIFSPFPICFFFKILLNAYYKAVNFCVKFIKCTALLEFLAAQLFKPRSTPQVERVWLPLLKNEKTAREIGDSKSGYDDETNHFGEIEENKLPCFLWIRTWPHECCWRLQSFKGLGWVTSKEFAVKAFKVRFCI